MFRSSSTSRGVTADAGRLPVARGGRVSVRRELSVLSLFSGAGGLDLGLEAAGFTTRLCVEIDDVAQRTLRRNRPAWILAEPGDVHQHTPRELIARARLVSEELDLLVGGPPCQPFSKSGYWATGDAKRLADPRASTLDAYLRVVEAALPRAILLENVRGFTYAGKDEGLRLLEEGFERINKKQKTAYRILPFYVNAADYGIPQVRERVFFVASRDGREFVLPKATHGDANGLQPYLTAWDAIADLDDRTGDLAATGKWARLLPSIPEGQNYLWHTPGSGGEPLFGWRTRYWSFLLKLAKNRPSWTIQAHPGPATGPFHWRSRPLTKRELARLQTFPDSYVIEGDRRDAQKQLGNAVPCALAELFGLAIREQLLGVARECRDLTLLPARRYDCPPPERRRPVPEGFLAMRGNHRPHPGTGRGPGAVRRNGEPGT